MSTFRELLSVAKECKRQNKAELWGNIAFAWTNDMDIDVELDWAMYQLGLIQPNQDAVRWYADSWLDLLKSQHDQPDYPYDGMSYFGTEAAGDERFQFWKDLRDYHGEPFEALVWKMVDKLEGRA